MEADYVPTLSGSELFEEEEEEENEDEEEFEGEEGEKEEEEEEEEEEEDKHKTFSEDSIYNLITNLEGKCLMLAMYLNIPTTTLVYMGHTAKAERMHKTALEKNILLYWMALRAATPNRAKGKELVRALRACDLDDVADTVMPTIEANEKFKSSEEIYQENRTSRKEEEEEED